MSPAMAQAKVSYWRRPQVSWLLCDRFDATGSQLDPQLHGLVFPKRLGLTDPATTGGVLDFGIADRLQTPCDVGCVLCRVRAFPDGLDLIRWIGRHRRCASADHEGHDKYQKTSHGSSPLQRPHTKLDTIWPASQIKNPDFMARSIGVPKSGAYPTKSTSKSDFRLKHALSAAALLKERL